MKLFDRPLAVNETMGGNLPHGAKAQRLNADQLRRAEIIQTGLMLAGEPRLLMAGIVGSWFMAAVAAWHRASGGWLAGLPWAWCSVVTLFMCARLLQLRGWQRVAQPATTLVYPSRVARVDGVLMGAVWGSGIWMLLPATRPEAEAVLIFSLAVVLLVSGFSMALQRSLHVAFVLAFTAVAVAGLLWLGGPFHWLFCVAFVVLAFCILTVGGTAEAGVNTAIKLSLQMEVLLDERTEQQRLSEASRGVTERALQQAELADKSKTTFLAAAGHDLRQPMHALVQYFGQLKRRNQDAALSDTLERAEKSLDAMQDLLNAILEVSKLMMGAVQPSIKRFRLTSVLDRIDAQLGPFADDKGLTLVIESNDFIAETDEILLERILRNLILNAIRYTSEGRVLVRCRLRRQKLSIQVWDSGIGISPEHQSRIFETFYQVGNTARDSHLGLGLGLSIVHQLSDLLRIPVRLRSTVGQGSVFTLGVPWAASLGDESAPLPDRSRDFLSGAYVVMIDDNVVSLEATCATLAHFGCHVLSATSGASAVAQLERQEWVPQLVISDYRLGDGESGIDAIGKVLVQQSARFGDEFPIAALVISGDTAPAELRRVQAAGYPMLSKPVKVDLLYASVNRELEKLACGAQADDGEYGSGMQVHTTSISGTSMPAGTRPFTL